LVVGHARREERAAREPDRAVGGVEVQLGVDGQPAHAAGAVHADDHGALAADEPQDAAGLGAEQRADLLGDRAVDLLQRLVLGDEHGDAEQSGLLSDDPDVLGTPDQHRESLAGQIRRRNWRRSSWMRTSKAGCGAVAGPWSTDPSVRSKREPWQTHTI